MTTFYLLSWTAIILLIIVRWHVYLATRRKLARIYAVYGKLIDREINKTELFPNQNGRSNPGPSRNGEIDD